MKKSIGLPLMSLILTSGVARAGINVIYGEDNRQEVYQASETHQLLARSTAVMVSETKISRMTPVSGQVELEQTTLRSWLEAGLESSNKLMSPVLKNASESKITFCEGTPFVDQPNPGMCSGFLIAPDLIVTAGHCVQIENFCNEYKWVFDFKVNESNQSAGLDIKEENVFSCKRIVSASLSTVLEMDYGLIQLDRSVKDRMPLKIRNESKISDAAPLVVIGNPSGLPTKVAAGANVRNNSHPFYFNANLDTFQGNSGSAVINSDTGIVEGILVRGEEDFRADKLRMCVDLFRCENDSCRGEDVNRIMGIPEVAVQKALNAAAETGNLIELDKILDLKIWVDFYTLDGESALMKATRASQLEAMRKLIAKGADVNLRNSAGESVLNIAKTIANESVIALLKEAGAVDVLETVSEN
jgi:hypothetical protein